MSTEAVTWAKLYKAQNATEKAILLILGDYANGDGVSWPGQQSISEQACCSKRTVIRVLDSLEERGIIARRERRRPDGSRTSDEIVLVAFLQGDNLSPSAEPRCHPVQAKVTPCPSSGDTMSPLTTFEPSEEPSENQARAKKSSSMPSDAECDAFQAAGPAQWFVSIARASRPLILSRAALRLGGMEKLIAAARTYSKRIEDADSKPVSLNRWLQDWDLVRECAESGSSRLPMPETPKAWARRVAHYQKTGEWLAAGPAPEKPGCLAPAEVLAAAGYPGKRKAAGGRA